MMGHKNIGAAAALVVAHLAGCGRTVETGSLRVRASGEGSFEIYRIASESPLQFVSEQAGRFNEDVGLAPGSYLVLADCSSESIIVYPGERVELIAHKLRFIPPQPPNVEDSFSIQCNRSEKTKSRQNISNRYDLHVIHGSRDLLVGMVPKRIDFKELRNDKEPNSPHVLEFKLSALQVANDGNDQNVSYFVSPVDEIIAATKYQAFGRWEFLLPGRYALEVNGTRLAVDLGEGEQRVIHPARLRVATSPSLDLTQPIRIRGSPWLVEVNGGHWLNFNETYPVLPGTASVAISGSSRSIEVDLNEGALQVLEARSITVDSGCSPTDMRCLGSHPVSLYQPNEPYPFVESVTDVPILVIDQGTPTLVSVEGSRDITVEVPANIRDRILKLGYLLVKPILQYRPGQITDLVRVDAINAPAAGHTLDLSLEHHTVVPLVAGTYQLNHYIGSSTNEGDRRNSPRTVEVLPGQTTDLELIVFISEKHFQSLRKTTTAAPSPDHPASMTRRVLDGRRVQGW